MHLRKERASPWLLESRQSIKMPQYILLTTIYSQEGVGRRNSEWNGNVERGACLLYGRSILPVYCSQEKVQGKQSTDMPLSPNTFLIPQGNMNFTNGEGLVQQTQMQSVWEAVLLSDCLEMGRNLKTPLIPAKSPGYSLCPTKCLGSNLVKHIFIF